MHLPFIGCFYALNLYLHCGYYIPFFEKVLPIFLINTSAWHNKHHSLRVAHFGEMLTLWDRIMGTHSEDWDSQQLEDTTNACVEESAETRGITTGKGNKGN